MRLNTYLNFNGQCEAAFRFYAQCLGGEILLMQTHKDSPMGDHVGPEWQDKILHVRLAAGDTLLMGSDSPPEYYQTPQGITVAINVDTVDEAERIFSELAAGGVVRMPLQETFWADRFGMLVDQFGTPWMINCEKRA